MKASTSTYLYRARIYKTYVTARQSALAPTSIAGLELRGPYTRRLIRRHFPQGRDAEIIDLGCGHGAIVHFLREAGYLNILGIDGSSEQVETARQLGIPGIEQGDVSETLAGLPNKSADCIITFDVIEHFNRDELIGFVDQIRRVLVKGGRWIIHVPNGESPFASRIRYGDFTHELAFTSNSIAQLLYASGFSDVRSYEDSPVPHGVKSSIRRLLWKFIRATLRIYIMAETGDTCRNAIFSQNMLTVAIK